MPSAFNVTATTNDVALPATRQGSVALTISNISGKPQQGRVSIAALDSTRATWLSVADGTDRTFPVGGAQQVTIRIAVPNDAAPGHYTFRPDVVAVQNPDEDSTQGPTLAFEVPPLPTPPPRKTPWPLIAAAAAVVVIVVGGVLAYLFYFTVIVPSVVGEDVAAARPTIVAAHLQPGTPAPQIDVSKRAGSVLSQTPGPQSRVGRGSTVSLVVAENAIVPKLIGQSAGQARTTLSSDGFQLGSTTFRSTLQAANGTVVDQSPAPGAVAAPGATINLVIEQNVTVPGVVNLTLGEAQSRLGSVGLRVGATTFQSTLRVNDGTVLGQSPGAGALVAPSAPVNLVVEQNAIVPAVTGRQYPDAASIVANAGLTAVPANPNCQVSFFGRIVQTESPPAGTRLPRGAPVQLVCL